MSTVPPYIALVVPFFFTITEVHYPGIALTLRHFASSKSEAAPVAYVTCLSSSIWKPSLLANWVVLKELRVLLLCVSLLSDWYTVTMWQNRLCARCLSFCAEEESVSISARGVMGSWTVRMRLMNISVKVVKAWKENKIVLLASSIILLTH